MVLHLEEYWLHLVEISIYLHREIKTKKEFALVWGIKMRALYWLPWINYILYRKKVYHNLLSCFCFFFATVTTVALKKELTEEAVITGFFGVRKYTSSNCRVFLFWSLVYLRYPQVVPGQVGITSNFNLILQQHSPVNHTQIFTRRRSMVYSSRIIFPVNMNYNGLSYLVCSHCMNTYLPLNYNHLSENKICWIRRAAGYHIQKK